MASLHFSGTDVKVFTPVSTALANLPNGAGTIVVLVKQTLAGGQDFCGLQDSSGGSWYHSLSTTSSAVSPTDRLFDDDGIGSTKSTTTFSSTTDWFVFGVDWPAGAGATERYHWRDQTTLAAWSHESSSTNNGGNRAGPGTTGWFRTGYVNDFATGAKDMAVVAVWAGTRFADGDYGSWTKTSDLYNHANGHPTFLCQLNASTLVDLIAGSTYSSANSSGTTLTGADPDNWTFDGVGGASPAPRTFNPIPFMGGVL